MILYGLLGFRRFICLKEDNLHFLFRFLSSSLYSNDQTNLILKQVFIFTKGKVQSEKNNYSQQRRQRIFYFSMSVRKKHYQKIKKSPSFSLQMEPFLSISLYIWKLQDNDDECQYMSFNWKAIFPVSRVLFRKRKIFFFFSVNHVLQQKTSGRDHVASKLVEKRIHVT